jgi:hypothetical protein
MIKEYVQYIFSIGTFSEDKSLEQRVWSLTLQICQVTLLTSMQTT